LQNICWNGGLFLRETHSYIATCSGKKRVNQHYALLRHFAAPGAEQAVILREQPKMLQPWATGDQKDSSLQERLLLFPVPRLLGISVLRSVNHSWRAPRQCGGGKCMV